MKNVRLILLILFVVLTFYCYGAGMMDYFAIYEPWKLIPTDEFAVFHQYQGKRIINIFVIPSAIMTLFNILVVIFPVHFVAKKWARLSLLAYTFDWIFSFTMQIPIQLVLEKRKDMVLIEELLYTNWFRFAADSLQFMFVCMLLWQVMKSAEEKVVASRIN
jgi:hypothetical protein